MIDSFLRNQWSVNDFACGVIFSQTSSTNYHCMTNHFSRMEIYK